MSLVIRLTRTGKKGERKFRIIVKEKRSRRDGTSLDMLGWYEKDGKDPLPGLVETIGYTRGLLAGLK